MYSQNVSESVDEFLNRIRKQPSSCKFGQLTEELICDKLVLGIRDQITKLRLLKEDNLTLNKAVDVCRASEASNVQVRVMNASSNEVERENMLRAKPYKKSPQSPR